MSLSPQIIILVAFFGLIGACSREASPTGREPSSDTRKAGEAFDGKVISEVDFRIDRTDSIDSARLRNHTQVRRGDPYSVERIDDDIRSIYESGYVDDVKVLVEHHGDGVRILYDVSARPSMRPRAGFVGNTAFSDQRLGKALTTILPPGRQVGSTDELEKARALLLSFYRDHGYSDAEITLRSWDGGAATRDDFFFAIEEGERSGSFQEP